MDLSRSSIPWNKLCVSLPVRALLGHLRARDIDLAPACPNQSLDIRPVHIYFEARLSHGARTHRVALSIGVQS